MEKKSFPLEKKSFPNFAPPFFLEFYITLSSWHLSRRSRRSQAAARCSRDLVRVRGRVRGEGEGEGESEGAERGSD